MKNSTATAIDIAKYIVYSFQNVGDYISNMKLQKLLYYIQGWHLAIYNTAAFDEKLEAWELGAVQPEVYYKYKKYEFRPITEDVEEPILDENLVELIDKILDEYGGETGFALHQLMQEEKAWLNAYKKKGFRNEIKKSAIKKFFKIKQEDALKYEKNKL